MRAAAYLRVSSAGQADEDKYGYERQIREIRAYATRNGFTVEAEYRDAITGKTATRVELQKLLKDALRFDAVIVSSVDRLARDFVKGAQIAEELHAAGFTVISAEIGPVFDSDTSTLQFHITGAVAEFERKQIHKRTIAAKIAMAEEGKLPLGIRTFGYESDGRGGARVVPEQATIVRRIFRLRVEGDTFRGIAMKLNREGAMISQPHLAAGAPTWYPATVGKLVSNRTYVGEHTWSYKGTTFEIPVPPLVSREVWNAAQSKKRGRRTQLHWLLSGFLWCGVCGSRMGGRRIRKKNRKRGVYEYYRCHSHGGMHGSCGMPHVPRLELEAIARREIRDKLTSEAFLRELLTLSDRETPEPARLEGLRVEKARLLKAYRVGALELDEFVSAREELDGEIRALETPPESAASIEDLMEAAASLPVREFLVASGVMIVVRDDFSLGFSFPSLQWC